jgi:hypothetical protein
VIEKLSLPSGFQDRLEGLGGWDEKLGGDCIYQREVGYSPDRRVSISMEGNGKCQG